MFSHKLFNYFNLNQDKINANIINMNLNFSRSKNGLGFILMLGCVCCLGVLLRAADRYVVEPGTIADGNGGIYTSWDIAATQIQWAVAAAESNTTIWVSNGTYVLTNQVATVYGTNITIRSVNGRAVTIVDGNREITSNRCFDLYTNATLDGFTVRNGCATNGSGGGGGIRANNSKVYNCRIENNVSTNADGAGINAQSSRCLVTNCQIIGNVITGAAGAGVYAVAGASISSCEIASNRSLGTIYGVGVRLRSGSIVSNCIIYANTATNSSTEIYGGGVCTYESSIVRNSLIYGNRVTSGGGGIWVFAIEGSSYEPKIQSCTVVSNYSSGSGAGIRISGYYHNTTYVENTISYYNTGNADSNLYYHPAHSGLYVIANSCIAPTSAILANISINTGNIQSNPGFVNWSNGNYRLKVDSPCVNAGTNQSWMTNAYDLGGAQRIRYGTVDMGAFERVNQGTVYTVH